MARLTFKSSMGSPNSHGAKVLGELIVAYWENARSKNPDELKALTEQLNESISELFEETQKGEVQIVLLQDTPDTVHIAIPNPAEDLSRYKQGGFDEAFGNAIVFGCGKGQPVRSASAPAGDELAEIRKRTKKAAA